MEEEHNMSLSQSASWLNVARDIRLSNEVRIYILLSLVHDGYLGINAAFDMCEDFGIFTTSRHTVSRELSMFMHPELYKNEES